MDEPTAPADTDVRTQDDSPRRRRAEEVFTRLFGPRDTSAPDADPELGEILRRMIFGDVFAIGDLDDQTRELITCTVLATQQALPRLRAHAGAALRVGTEPVALREAMYQLAPFIGFPRTLNAVGVLDEVLRAAGHELPLPDQGTIPTPSATSGASPRRPRCTGRRSPTPSPICRPRSTRRSRVCSPTTCSGTSGPAGAWISRPGSCWAWSR